MKQVKKRAVISGIVLILFCLIVGLLAFPTDRIDQYLDDIEYLEDLEYSLLEDIEYSLEEEFDRDIELLYSEADEPLCPVALSDTADFGLEGDFLPLPDGLPNDLPSQPYEKGIFDCKHMAEEFCKELDLPDVECQGVTTDHHMMVYFCFTNPDGKTQCCIYEPQMPGGNCWIEGEEPFDDFEEFIRSICRNFGLDEGNGMKGLCDRPVMHHPMCSLLVGAANCQPGEKRKCWVLFGSYSGVGTATCHCNAGTSNCWWHVPNYKDPESIIQSQHDLSLIEELEFELDWMYIEEVAEELTR